MPRLILLFHCDNTNALFRKPTYELNSLAFKQQQNLGRRFGTSKIFLSPLPQWLCFCPFKVDYSVVVDTLLTLLLLPLSWFSVCSLSLSYNTLCHFWFCNHLDEEERTGCVTSIIFVVSFDCYFSVALSRGAWLGLQCVSVVFLDNTHINELFCN